MSFAHHSEAFQQQIQLAILAPDKDFSLPAPVLALKPHNILLFLGD